MLIGLLALSASASADAGARLSSLLFLHSAADSLNNLEFPTCIHYLGEFDSSGVSAGGKIEEAISGMAPNDHRLQAEELRGDLS